MEYALEVKRKIINETPEAWRIVVGDKGRICGAFVDKIFAQNAVG
jgi:hypothetical protein